jgi:hypothetical protein
VIVGNGINPEGKHEAWIAKLDQTVSASGPPGNFNGDSSVDAADYVTWREGLGTEYSQADYGVWKSNFGNQRPPVPRGTPVSSADVSPAKELLSFIVDGSTYRRDDLIQPTMTEYAGASTSIIVASGTAVPAPGDRSELLTNDFQMDTGITNPDVGPAAVSLNFSPPLVNGPGPDLVMFEITRNVSEPPDALQMQVNSTTGFLSDWGPQLSTVSFDAYARTGGTPANISQLENDAFSKSGNFPASSLHGMAIDLDKFDVGALEQRSTIQFGSFGGDSFDPVLFMGIRSAAALGGDFAVPEPTTATLILFTLALLACLSRAYHARLPERRRVWKPERANCEATRPNQAWSR